MRETQNSRQMQRLQRTFLIRAIRRERFQTQSPSLNSYKRAS